MSLRQPNSIQRVHVIDTHTGGEPTRVVIFGGPQLHPGPLSDQRRQFDADYDWFRAALIDEPRGGPVWVGALVCRPVDPSCCCGVIFFNNVGTLGMCGHGTIGVVAALRHLNWMQVGRHRMETPVGIITVEAELNGRVSIENVPSYRWRSQVEVEVPNWGNVRGDIAWGGNWFFLVHEHEFSLVPSNIPSLLTFTSAIQDALFRTGIRGKDGGVVDHVELTGPASGSSSTGEAFACGGQNFVLCPGGAWDRSPCGTGTSAKVACLAADGKLAPGQIWRQQSVIGSVFEATYRWQDPDEASRQTDKEDGIILPKITGEAWVIADSQLILDPQDPFRFGIPL